MPKQHSTITKDTSIAAKFLAEGRIIAFPTGTFYGLAVNALEGYALQRLRNLKGRPDEKTFTVFLADKIWKEHLDLTEAEKQFLANTTNKPLTLLVKPRPSLQHLASNNLIGLRVIDHPIMQELAQKTSLPLTATSANKTGATPCSSPQCIQTTFPGLLPDDQINETDPKGASGATYDLSLATIIDDGQLLPSKPTTIARLSNSVIKIIRPGSLSLDELKANL